MHSMKLARASLVFGRHPGLISSSLQAPKAAKRQNSQHRVILVPEIPDDTEETNEILQHYTKGYPKFSNITDRKTYYGLGKALLEYEAAILEAEKLCESGSQDFDAIFVPLEKAKCQFESVLNTAIVLHSATDSLNEDRFLQIHKRCDRAARNFYVSKSIYQGLKNIEAEYNAGNIELDQQKYRIMEKLLYSYQLTGFELDDKKYNELAKNYFPKMVEEKLEFNYRTEMFKKLFKATISDPQIMRDFPVDVLRAMSLDNEPTKGPWQLTLHPYLARKFLEYCPERNYRRNLYSNLVTVGEMKGHTDRIYRTIRNCEKLRKHRYDRALCLGYANHADLVLENTMAMNVDNVHTMISNLLGKAKEAQEKELTELQEYAELRGFDFDLTDFDIPFYMRKQRRTNLGVTEDEIREFFPLPKVIAGLFNLCKIFFGVRIEDISNTEHAKNLWSPEVKMFRIFDDASGQALGEFYLDPYIRDDKMFMGGDRGFYLPLRNKSVKGGCNALGTVLLSLPLPGYGKPSLLSYDEVQEVFRIFGNLLNHQCSEADWSSLSGKFGLEKDVQNVSSDFMQCWVQEPQILINISGHWSNNESLSKTVADELCSFRRQMAGYYLCKDLFKSAYDMLMHTKETGTLDMVTDELYSQYLLIPMLPEDSFPSHFFEIFNGENDCTYYSKIWSKMLAADIFSAVQEAGMNSQEDVKKVTMRFRKTFLSQGSILPGAQLFREFRGRDPSHEALLLSLGLKEMSQPKKKRAKKGSE